MISCMFTSVNHVIQVLLYRFLAVLCKHILNKYIHISRLLQQLVKIELNLLFYLKSSYI